MILNKEEKKKYKGKLLTKSEAEKLEEGEYIVGLLTNVVYVKVSNNKVMCLEDGRTREIGKLLLCEYLGRKTKKVKAEDF